MAGQVVGVQEVPRFVPDAIATQQVPFRRVNHFRRRVEASPPSRRLVDVKKSAPCILHDDAVRNGAEHDPELVARMLDRRQGRGLRVEVTPDAADLLADGRHQAQHLFVGRPRLGGEQLDDRGDGLAVADGERGGAGQAGLDGQSKAQTLRRSRQLLDPHRLPLGRGLSGRILAGPQDGHARDLHHVGAHHLVVCPDGLAPQHTLFVGRPVHRERPMELRRDRPQDLGDGLLEGAGL